MRLIDANALMEYLLEKLAMYDSVGAKMGLVPLTIRNDLQGFVETIKEQPTVDAVPVVHGKWVYPSRNAEFVNREFFSDCSVCGTTYMDETPYCPNCGAKMDGKEKENG